jgi:ABC-type branched-subunit amino acid transport system substrate-binding protein
MAALAYFHLVNDPGGVHGRSLELKSLDDGYDPEKAPACFNRLAKEDLLP